MELFTRQAAVALFFGLFATSTQAKEFSYLETFDDDATFSAGGALPDGWLGDASAVPVQRYEGSYLGSGNHSGSCSARWHQRAWDATAGYTPAS